MDCHRIFRCLLPFLLAALALPCAADDPAEGRERWHRMTPEARQQMREQIREHWARMAPEEREAHLARRAERMRERLSKMSPEERERMREQLRRHRHRHEGEGQVESGP